MFRARRIRWSIVSGLALLLVASLLFASCAPAGPTPTTPGGQVVPVSEPIYKWRLQTCDYPADIASQFWPQFAEHVKVMTGGRVEITSYVAGELVGGFEVFDAVAAGTLELGSIYSFYVGGKVPLANVMYTMPFVVESYEEANYLVRETEWEELLRGAYAEQGVQLIASEKVLWDYGNFMSSVPVWNLDDIEGLKIRAGGVFADLYEKLGASVVSLPKEDLYTALATGTINAVVWGSAYGFYDNNFYEVCKYYLQPPFQWFGQWDLIMNPDIYNELPDDIKLVLWYAMKEVNVGVNRIGWYRDADALARMQEAGVTITTLPEEDMAAIKKIVWDEIYPELAATDPLAAKAIEILKEVAKDFGHRE